MRITIAGALCLSIVGLCFASEGWAAVKHPTHIAAQGLGPALEALAKEHTFQVLYRTEVVSGLTSPSINGDLTTEQALQKLLSGTGLSYRYLGHRAITIVPAGFGAKSTDSRTESQRVSAGSNPQGRGARGGGAASGPFRMAQMGEGATGGAAGAPAGSRTGASGKGSEAAVLQEIIVSAEKVKESALDVPMSLTALSGARLLRSHSFRFEDYVGTVPGLTVVNYGAFGSQLVIRGITAGSVPINTSVATYIDETPYGVEGPFAGSGFAAPDLDTFDMQRIEVLRGPQGTLYGSNALAGLVKYVTNPPDPRAFRAEAEAGASSVSHGGVGYDFHGMVNLPLSATTALRLVGYQNFYPGFIDDPGRGLTDINGIHFSGGRASLSYAPSDALSLRLNALYQNRSYGDLSNEDVNPVSLTPIHGDWIQENLVGQPGRTMTQTYNATIQWQTSFLKLVSATSYMRFEPSSIWDWSKEFGPVLGPIFGEPLGAVVQNIRPAKAWTQELRLSSGEARSFDWLIGTFFTDEDSTLYESLSPVDPASRSILYGFSPQLTTFIILTHYREYAGFMNLDYHITPTLDVALGGRYSRNSQRYHETESGLLIGPAEDFGTSSSQGVFTYSADVRWRIAGDRMLYGRIAKGFVPGGPNDVIPTTTYLPRSYSSSTTTNYEVGFKSRLLNGRLTSDLSAFYIDWNRIQVLATVGVFNSITNGGTARSGGFEWSFGYIPVEGLTLGFNGSYTHAFLTQPTPASVGGNVGDRLPYVPLVETSLEANYRHPLFPSYYAFAGVGWRFSSSRYADFAATGPRQEMPRYHLLDLRGGLETDRWSLSAYVKNVGNSIAINDVASETLAGGAGPQSAVLNTPRTIGVSLTVDFP